jgi:adenosylcobinamide-GDP ribazoletransferase
MKSLILMLQFFTRIPINTELDIKEDSFAKGIAYFPIVGLVIGFANAIVYYGFSRLLPGILPLIMVTLTNIVITGALHLDGLADACDGIFSARSKERMLEIMKDSRIGTNGAIAIFFDLVLRIALLGYISDISIIKVILITPIISRTMMSVLIYISSNNGKGNGLGSLFIGRVKLSNLIIALAIGTLLSTIVLGYICLIIIVINVVFIFIYKRYILSKLGVVTGDTLGAANELSELLILLSFVIIERFLLV